MPDFRYTLGYATQAEVRFCLHQPSLNMLLKAVPFFLLLAWTAPVQAQVPGRTIRECVGPPGERRSLAAAIYDDEVAKRENQFLESFFRELAVRARPEVWPTLGRAAVAVGGGMPPSIVLDWRHSEMVPIVGDDGSTRNSIREVRIEPSQLDSIYLWIRHSLDALERPDDSADVAVSLHYPDPHGGACG